MTKLRAFATTGLATATIGVGDEVADHNHAVAPAYSVGGHPAMASFYAGKAAGLIEVAC